MNFNKPVSLFCIDHNSTRPRLLSSTIACATATNFGAGQNFKTFRFDRGSAESAVHTRIIHCNNRHYKINIWVKSAVLLYEEMCAELLREAPITDVSLASQAIPDLQDYKRPIKNRVADIRLMKNPKFIERLQAETAQKIPFNIRLVLIDGNHEEMFRRLASLSGYKGYSTYASGGRRDTVSSLAAEVWPPTPDTITLVFGSTGDPLKLSPNKKGVWMVGHKLGHALFDAVNQEVPQLAPNVSIESRIREEIEYYFKKLHPQGHPNKGNGLFELYKDISAFSSAQLSNMESHDEYLYELVAQYVMFGKVTFKVGHTFPTKEEAAAAADKITKMIIAAMKNAVGTTLVDVV